MQTLYYKSTGKITTEVKDGVTKDPIEDATVTITIYDDKTDAQVSGSSWPYTMTYDGEGVYSFRIDATLKNYLMTGSIYRVDVDIQKNSSYGFVSTKFKILYDDK